MKVVHCPCGANIEGETEDALVENVQAHFVTDHPDLVGKYSERPDPGDGPRALSRRPCVLYPGPPATWSSPARSRISSPSTRTAARSRGEETALAQAEGA